MPFLAKHVQLRQVKTSHAEVLAQDAESEQQRRVSMKIELTIILHQFSSIFYHGRRRRRRRRRPPPHPQGELRARGCINPHVLGARLSPALVYDRRSACRASSRACVGTRPSVQTRIERLATPKTLCSSSVGQHQAFVCGKIPSVRASYQHDSLPR